MVEEAEQKAKEWYMRSSAAWGWGKEVDSTCPANQGRVLEKERHNLAGA